MNRKLNCILLVDDDVASNFINKKTIEKAGIAEKVDVVLNGKEALDYLTNSGSYKTQGAIFPQPMLIFLDINMPVMDGWEFLQEYDQLPDYQKAQIVIVMLTSSQNPDDKTRAQHISSKLGFKNKPLTVELLNEIVATHFGDFLERG